MKKLILILLLFISCGTPLYIIQQTPNCSYQQLDSIFKVEKIATYDSIPFQDYETKQQFYQYYFIRDSLVLHWIKRGDSIQITKRIYK